ncbi:MAG TPA: hypothetical protein VIM73_14510, partial [Polyangiaceae bacterium]
DRFKDLREMGRELLFLAGQRTRITWGLSFGDVHPPKEEQQHAPGEAEVAGTAFLPRWRRYVLPALAVAALLGLAVGLTSYLSRPEATSVLQPAPSVPVPVVEASRTEVDPARTQAAVAAAQSVTVPQPAPPVAAAPVAERRPRRARANPAPNNPSYAANGSAPEWEIEPSPMPPGPSKSDNRRPSGANGAPIFD